MTTNLSSFEYEVLDVLARWGAGCSAPAPIQADVIQENGERFFGSGWGGNQFVRNGRSMLIGTYTYPNINLALGRLAKKGLVQRRDWMAKGPSDYQAGQWWITDGGKNLMGYAS